MKRQDAIKRLRTELDQLETARAQWEPHWREIERMILPRRGRWLTTDQDKEGDKLNKDILDATGTYASRTLTAGLMSGMTSPMRRWFSLRHPDPRVMARRDVRNYTHDATLQLRKILSASNLYRTLPQIYEEGSGFGTGAMSLREGSGKGTLARSLLSRAYTVGEYACAVDHEGVVSTFMRRAPMTADQLESKFETDKLPTRVKDALTAGRRHEFFELQHLVLPNRDEFEEAFPEARGRRWLSIYLVGYSGRNARRGYDANEGELEVGGFDRFPFHVFRWSVRPGDVYGRGPGMDALPDVKQLQAMTRQFHKALAKAVDPPLQAPDSIRSGGGAVRTVPGGVNYYQSVGQGNHRPIEPLYVVDPHVREMQAMIADQRMRIEKAFYADLFVTTLGLERSEVTAREIEERSQEKLMMLGDAYQRLQDEILRPVVENGFHLAAKLQVLPPAPPELRGGSLEIEFASILEDAIKTIEMVAYDRFTQSMGAVQQIMGRPVDQVDWDKVVEHYTERADVDPDVLKDARDVKREREAMAEQAAQAEQAEVMERTARAAKDATAAKVGDQNLLEIAAEGNA